MLTSTLLQACTGCGRAEAITWATPLDGALQRYQVTTNLRLAAFLAQVTHESGGFTELVENTSYSAAGLLAEWPKHFTPEQAAVYAHKPQAIASRAYANRDGNGDEASGDGWRFRGRGPMQTTGRDDYRDAGDALGLALLDNPDLLLQPINGALAAGWEWDRGACNALADARAFEEITRRINGGLTGQAHRLSLYERALGVLNT